MHYSGIATLAYQALKVENFLFLAILPFSLLGQVPEANHSYTLTTHPTKCEVGEDITFSILPQRPLKQIMLFAESWRIIIHITYAFQDPGVYKLSIRAFDEHQRLLGVESSEITVTENRISTEEKEITFPPTPLEDPLRGRNANVYESATGHPTEQEKRVFVQKMRAIIEPLARKYQLPAEALVAIACQESGYGYTRTAAWGNNLFGIKCWACGEPEAFQLIGQPDEDEGRVPVTGYTPLGEALFLEDKRKDNWYYRFNSAADCLQFFVNEVLLYKTGRWPKDYRSVVRSYRQRIDAGWSDRKAALAFLYDLAEHGYNHQGGTYYQEVVGKVMSEF